MQSFLEILAWLEVRLPPCRDIHDLTRPRISSGWLGFRRFHRKHTESPHLNAVPFNELFPHGFEETIDHRESEKFTDTGRFSDGVSKMFLRDRLDQFGDSLKMRLLIESH